MVSEWKKRRRRAVTAVRILYHGFSVAGLREDIKRVWTWLAGWAASLPLLFERVRDWLTDPTTYQFLVARIGYLPVLYGILLASLAIRKTYRRGLAFNETERAQIPDSPSSQMPAQADPSEAGRFHNLADEAMTVTTFLISEAQYAPHQIAEHQVRFYALIDNLSGLGVMFPAEREHTNWRDHALMLVGLMRNGNLEKARTMFPLAQPGAEA